jgi:hypothetical protein
MECFHSYSSVNKSAPENRFGLTILMAVCLFHFWCNLSFQFPSSPCFTEYCPKSWRQMSYCLFLPSSFLSGVAIFLCLEGEKAPARGFANKLLWECCDLSASLAYSTQPAQKWLTAFGVHGWMQCWMECFNVLLILPLWHPVLSFIVQCCLYDLDFRALNYR